MSPPKKIIQRLAGLSDIFVETGTYHGDTALLALECGFKKVYTIEIHPPAYEIAKERCRGLPVNLWLGDSGRLLSLVLGELEEPAVIFLDAHFVAELPAEATGRVYDEYSPFSPLGRELRAIAASVCRHVVCIDDIDFMDKLANPATMEEIRNFFPGYSFEIVEGTRPKSLLIAMPP
jgi:hypothetical protein